MSTIKILKSHLECVTRFRKFTKKLKQQDKWSKFLRARGFEFIKTPTLEYYDTVGKASAIYDATII